LELTLDLAQITYLGRETLIATKHVDHGPVA
jgi:hypothetical protein